MTDDAERLAQAIAQSGMSARQFAQRVMLRNERTIRRWLARDAPIPDEVRKWLDEHVK